MSSLRIASVYGATTSRESRAPAGLSLSTPKSIGIPVTSYFLEKTMLYPKPQIYHDLKAIFVHVPKTAGTSIERQLAESSGIEIGGHTTAPAFRRAYPKEFASYFKFTVVREPLDRFVSAYRYLRAAGVHPAHQNEVIHRLNTLEAFVDFVSNEPRALERIVHMIPQHKFICDPDGAVLVDQVYKFEELETGWADICHRIGLYHKPLARLNVSRLPFDADSLGESIRAFVAKNYADDCRILEYLT